MSRLQSELTVETAVGHQTKKNYPSCALSDVPADIPLGAEAVPVPRDDQSDHFAMCARMVLTNAHEVAIRTPPVAASPDAAAELISLSPICTPRKMLPKHRVHSAPHTTQNHPVAMPPLNVLVPWPLHGHHILS